MTEKAFYRVDEVAEMFDVTTRTIQLWLRAGRFPNAKRLNPDLERSPWLIPAADIEAVKKELDAE